MERLEELVEVELLDDLNENKGHSDWTPWICGAFLGFRQLEVGGDIVYNAGGLSVWNYDLVCCYW